MNRSNPNTLRWRRLYRGIAISFVVLATLCGCLSSNTKWEEDRSILFSPDDRAIAYRHMGAVYVARTQGDRHRRIFNSAPGAIVSTPHWAPGQRAVLFAVSDGTKSPDTGLLTYELWYWPAPEDIWTSEVIDLKEDTVELPARWKPADPRMILSASCLDEMQIKSDALFSWHPDGNQVLFLYSDTDGLQTVMSFDRQANQMREASPIRAVSLAFSISPQGNHLQVAAADAKPTALWLGPIGTDDDSWRNIESTPGPSDVPQLELSDDRIDDRASLLYDLRPRLGAWSPDGQWLAHTRLVSDEPQVQTSDDAADQFALVMTPISGGESQRVLALSGSRAVDLHWWPGGSKLALLSDTKLLVVDPRSNTVDELSGVLDVERFIGWSAPGDHMAYLISAEQFDETGALLPTGQFLLWSPAERHNLMVAAADGTLPGSRFSLMNITAARWGNKTEKLSFWATYQPTVSLLPPGDPAAVLDLDTDTISWYPTDIAEYANVGHYYLLNEKFAEAAKHYGNALGKITNRDVEENRLLMMNIRLWRGIARLGSGQGLMAANDFQYVRDNIVPNFEEAPGWSRDVLPDLVADREILSTMLSMGQVQLAIDEARRIIEEDQDARRIQALCYLALVYSSVGQPTLFTDNVVLKLIPEAIESEQVPRQQADALIREYLESVSRPAILSQLTNPDKMRYGAGLAEQAAAIRTVNSESWARLSRSAVVFYRESGATEAEIELLRSIAGT